MAKYIFTVEGKPDIVSRGRNWVMKDFGAAINDEYKNHKEKFNEFYFVKCVSAAIIFRNVDDYLEQLKKIPDAWYKVGGYKMNIVPYSIAKILSSVPKGYSMDWQLIWEKQSLYPAFMKEIEIVTKLTNDFICDSHGMIVTEYCKRKATWEEFRNKVSYKPSIEFLNNLIPIEFINERANQAKKEQKSTDSIVLEIKIAELGSIYWKRLLEEGLEKNLLNYKELTLLKAAIDIERTGKMPSSLKANAIMNIRTKLENQGIII